MACLAWLVEQAMAGRQHQNYWWVAPSHGQARIAFRRMKAGLPRSLYSVNESEQTITLANGATVWFKSGENPDLLYGEDVYAAVIDEYTRVREESFHAVRSTLTATRGPVRLIGNVKGRRNWGYKLARRAEAGEPDMAYHRITATEAVAAGVLDRAEIEDARRVLPEAVFRELYEAEASDDEGNPFGYAAIHSNIAPLADSTPALYGIDLAKSIDYTVLIGLDGEGRTCSVDRFQIHDWEETNARIVRVVGLTPCLVDSTGVGDAVVDRLRRRLPGTVTGYTFTPKSKQQLMEGLAVAIQQHEITYPDGPIVLELEAFEYSYQRNTVRYSAPEGMHDDCVCALALAVSARTVVRKTEELFSMFDRTIDCGACGYPVTLYDDTSACHHCGASVGHDAG